MTTGHQTHLLFRSILLRNAEPQETLLLPLHVLFPGLLMGNPSSMYVDSGSMHKDATKQKTMAACLSMDGSNLLCGVTVPT